MKVKGISLFNFMSHTGSHVEFPDKGVVVITGPNGHGKSALIEATPAAVWNETLRGTPWYRKDEKSNVSVVLECKDKLLDISRAYSAKGIQKLRIDGLGEQEFDSATKAQEALDSVLGSYEIWKRTHVFSSADDAHLSRATDGQRKRFMETILGLDKFDRALKACKEDLKQSSGFLHTAQTDYTLMNTKQTYEKARLEEALKSRKAVDLPVLEQDSIEPTLQKRLNNDIRAWEEERRRLCGQIDLHDFISKQADKEKRLLSGDKCPTCKQGIPKQLTEELTKQAETAYFKLEDVKKSAHKTIETLDSLIDEAKQEVREHVTQQAKIDEALRTFNRLKQERERLDKIVEEATAANAEYLRRRSEYRSEIGKFESEVAILAVCEKLLGLRGIRANITSHALEGLEEIANQWLERFTVSDSQQIKLHIRPYKELKRGGVSDEWSIELDGIAGGFGYRAASAGQRQRIDVALLFASMHIAQAALGMPAGTIFFDEVFDHLDEAGVSAVVSFLAELAEDRLVIVVSHSKDLLEAIRPVLKINVEKGEVNFL